MNLFLIPLFAVLIYGWIQLGRWLRARLKMEELGQLGALEGALFGLMGLLLAFVFSGAASRYDERRQLILEEANDIGTAYLRLDLLPAARQEPLRDLFRRYVEGRLEYYRRLGEEPGAVEQAWKQSCDQQHQIWKLAVEACAAEGGGFPPMPGNLVLPSLNAMFDIANSRRWAREFHPPGVVYMLLFTVSMVCSTMAGLSIGPQRSQVHTALFSLTLAVTLSVIADLERPRSGLVRLDRFDQILQDVRTDMN